MSIDFIRIVAIVFAFSMASTIALPAQTSTTLGKANATGVSAADEPDYSSLFPNALPGWTAGKVDVKTINQKSDVLGPIRRIQLVRAYTSEKSDSQVEILIDDFDIAGGAVIDAAHTDEKTLADLKGKASLHDFRGNKGLESYDEQNNLHGMLIHIEDTEKVPKASSDLVLTIAGKNASEQEMMSYLEKVDLGKIRAFPWNPLQNVPPLF